MAFGRAIGGLYAQITANASQFIAEFNRADNASRRSAANIDREVDKLTRNIKRKFSTADIGKDVLRGLGIGSGFAAAQQVAEKISDYWREAAESAARITAESDKQLETVMKGIAARQTEDQRLAALAKDIARLEKERAAANAGTGTKQTISYTPGSMWPTYGTAKVQTSQDLETAAAKAREVNEVGAESDEIERKKAERAKEAAEKLAKDMVDLAKAEAAEKADVYADLQKAVDKTLRESAELEAELAEAKRKALQEEIEAGNKLFLAAEEAKRKAQEETAEAARRFNEELSGTLADSLIGVTSLTDAFKSLALQIAKAWVQKNVTDGLVSSLTSSGIWSAAKSFMGFRAAGGSVQGGGAYMVGEQGPELFVPPSSGTIVPAGKTAAMTGGGAYYYIDAKGADSAAIGRIESALRALHESIEPRSRAAVADAMSRGGGFGRNFA